MECINISCSPLKSFMVITPVWIQYFSANEVDIIIKKLRECNAIDDEMVDKSQWFMAITHN